MGYRAQKRTFFAKKLIFFAKTLACYKTFPYFCIAFEK